MGWDPLKAIELTREQMEQRRLAAARDLKAGVSQADVAREYGVSEASVSVWARKLRQGGMEALERRKPRGQPPKLTSDQMAQLPGILLRGAPAYGWSTDLWTTQRIAEVIERVFGVRYHRNYMGRLMAKIRFSLQKPARRAREKDEGKKRTWLRTTWPALKKNSGRAGPSSSSTRAGSPRRRSSRGRGPRSGRRRSSSTRGTGTR